MAIIQFNGPGILIPPPPPVDLNASSTTLALADGLTMNDTSDRIAFIGRVNIPGSSGSKAVRKVHFRTGSSLVKAGASAVRISLQDVDLANGPPIQPDGTVDQSYTIANTNTEAGWSANSWFTTGNFSADRTVNHGDLLAVVFEFTTRNGSDTVTLSGLQCIPETGPQHQSAVVSRSGGTWSVESTLPNVLLEFSDGTFGRLGDSFHTSGLSALSFDSGTGTADEYGLEFQLPFDFEVDGFYALVSTQTGSNFEMLLYSGTTALATVTVDANATLHATNQNWIFRSFAKQTLSANTTYRIAVRPTTTNNIVLQCFNVSANGHFGAHAFGTVGVLAARLNQGSWNAANTTRRPFMGIRLTGVDVTPGGSSGGARAF